MEVDQISNDGTDVQPVATPGDELEAAKAEVKKALSGEPEPAKTEDGSKEEPAAKTEEEPSEKEIRRALANRSKVVKERQAAKEEAERIKHEALQLKYEMEQQRQEIARQAEWLRQLRLDPVKAIRETGVDPEEFIGKLARSGSYEGKLEMEIAKQKAQMEDLRQQQLRWAQEQEQFRQQQIVAQQQQFRSSVEEQFSAICLNEEKFPHLTNFYADRKQALISEGDWIADQYREATGREASLEDIAEYIEEQMSSAYNKFQEKKKSVSSPVKAKQSKVESAKPVKTISSKDSERGSLPASDNLSELDDDDLMKLAKQEARKALFEAKDS